MIQYIEVTKKLELQKARWVRGLRILSAWLSISRVTCKTELVWREKTPIERVTWKLKNSFPGQQFGMLPRSPTPSFLSHLAQSGNLGSPPSIPICRKTHSNSTGATHILHLSRHSHTQNQHKYTHCDLTYTHISSDSTYAHNLFKSWGGNVHTYKYKHSNFTEGNPGVP